MGCTRCEAYGPEHVIRGLCSHPHRPCDTGCPGHWDSIPDAGLTFINENHFLVIDRPGDHEGGGPKPPNFELIAPALEARGSRLTETLLSSSEVRHRMRGADDIVRRGLRKGEKSGAEERARRITETKSWYDEVEGLVPPSVLGHIVRYGLYSREDSLPGGDAS